MKSEINHNDSFEAGLVKYCESGKSGTILIATNTNKSCQISIEAGEIIAVSMGRLKGYDAAQDLSTGGIKRSSFTENLKFPHTKEAFISSSNKFLEKINLKSELSIETNLDQVEQQAVAA